MSDTQNDFLAENGTEEDQQLENALLEYADSMEDGDKDEFLKKIREDRDFYFSMGKSLSEMAMLIAGAAVIDDDAEFSKMRKRILFEARKDTAEIKQMRLYYLENRNAMEMDAVMDGDEEKRRFDERLSGFLDDYKQHHPS